MSVDTSSFLKYDSSMLLKLLLAFTLIPIAEIYLLIEIGHVIGSLSTVLLVIATGIVGAYLARMQGMQTMRRIQHSLGQGVMPAEALIDALLIFAAGVVLLAPGFITDAVGLLLLFPVTRYYFKGLLKRKINRWIKNQTIHFNRY